jgi:Fe-S cluster assembly protein SufD
MPLDLLRDTSSLCMSAREALAAKGLPSAKAEAWIYTRLSDITINPAAPSADEVAEAPAVLSFSQGWLQSGADSLPEGITLSEMSDEAMLAEFASFLPDDHLLSQLSLGHATGAYLIDIKAGFKADMPLQLVFAGGDEGSSAHPLIYVKIGEAAEVQLAEIHGSDTGLSAPVTVISAAKEAMIDHIKLQQDEAHCTHLALTVMDVAEKAQINSFTAALGAKLGRHETHANLNGEEIDMALSSLYLGRGSQHHDITTRMHHFVPNCTSDQVIRGVLDDSAKGVFQGKVLVARDAQKTDGQQMSRALLLSRKAEADAKPELEIYADDVVCSHGATVGELDETHLFYLKSRGIAEAEARAMLIEAFVKDALEQVRVEALSDILVDAVTDWMTGGA